MEVGMQVMMHICKAKLIVSTCSMTLTELDNLRGNNFAMHTEIYVQVLVKCHQMTFTAYSKLLNKLTLTTTEGQARWKCSSCLRDANLISIDSSNQLHILIHIQKLSFIHYYFLRSLYCREELSFTNQSRNNKIIHSINSTNMYGNGFNIGVGVSINQPGGFSQPQTNSTGFTQPQTYGTGYNQPQTYGTGYNQPQTYGTGYNQPQIIGGGFNQPQIIGGGFNQPQTIGGFNQPQTVGGGGFVNLGGVSANFGVNPNPGVVNLGAWSFNGNWGTNNDSFLQNQINRVYMKYDFNQSGQLEGQQFANAYRDLCVSVGQNPPDYYTLTQLAQQGDTNFDGKISKLEMFTLFKRCQFSQY